MGLALKHRTNSRTKIKEKYQENTFKKEKNQENDLIQIPIRKFEGNLKNNVKLNFNYGQYFWLSPPQEQRKNHPLGHLLQVDRI